MSMIKGGLSSEFIAELQGKARVRNLYGPMLIEFDGSDEPGVDVQEAWPIELGQKSASTLYQGFLTAAKKAKLYPDVLTIKQSDEHVYILHNERYKLALETLAAESQNGNSPSEVEGTD